MRKLAMKEETEGSTDVTRGSKGVSGNHQPGNLLSSFLYMADLYYDVLAELMTS